MSDTRRGEERKAGSLGELPAAIEPARDLWPQIETRIRQEQGRASASGSAQPRAGRFLLAPPRWLAAAAVVASVAVVPQHAVSDATAATAEPELRMPEARRRYQRKSRNTPRPRTEKSLTRCVMATRP